MGVLFMAITIGGVFVAAAALAAAIFLEKAWLRNFVLGALAIWFVSYALVLVGVSLMSEEKTLAPNEAKEFCGFYLDCHMHTAVTGIWKAKTIGNKTANGEFYIVTVKVFSNAKRATLGFGGLKFIVRDAEGRSYPHVLEAEADEPWFTRPVSPGGSFEREVVFDLPLDVSSPRPDVYGYPNKIEALIEMFLIGDEDSILHKRRYFDMTRPAVAAAAH